MAGNATGGTRRSVVGRLGRLALVVGLAGLAWTVAVPPRTRPGSALTAFAPARLGSLEQQAWEAYYYRQWLRLFWLLLQISRTHFGLSWLQALYAAYLATRAQVIFARQGDAGGEAQASMRRFYQFVRAPAGGAYDPERAAAAELDWWVVHRRRHEYPDNSTLVDAMAALYAEVYRLPPEWAAAAARHRVEAVAISDRWLDAGKPAGSPLLDQIRDELSAAYSALQAAAGSS